MIDHSASPESPFGDSLWDVLARYVSGESPVQEAAAVRRWLAEDPRRAEVMSSLERALTRLAFAAPADLDIEVALHRVRERISAPDVRPLSSKPARRWITVGLRAAAVVVLAIGGALLWRSVHHPVAGADQLVAARAFSTPPGRSDSIRLADGSLVILGPGSDLTVAAGYGEPDRALSLQGDALFDIVHDELHPFRVRAGVALIQDLGTTFAVRNDGVEDVRIVVTAGSVLLQGTDKGRQKTSRAGQTSSGVILKGGDRGSVDRDGHPSAEPNAATPDDLSWTRGRLLFENASLARVRSDLRRWYGVDLRIADSSLANRHLTASFAGEPIERVLDVIGLALGAKVERQGNTAVLKTR